MEDSLASSVFVGAPMAIVAVDRTGRVRNHNPAAQQLFGAVLDDPSLSIDALFEGFNLDLRKNCLFTNFCSLIKFNYNDRK